MDQQGAAQRFFYFPLHVTPILRSPPASVEDFGNLPMIYKEDILLIRKWRLLTFFKGEYHWISAQGWGIFSPVAPLSLYIVTLVVVSHSWK